VSGRQNPPERQIFSQKFSQILGLTGTGQTVMMEVFARIFKRRLTTNKASNEEVSKQTEG
jgi:hypothetical protein